MINLNKRQDSYNRMKSNKSVNNTTRKQLTKPILSSSHTEENQSKQSRTNFKEIPPRMRGGRGLYNQSYFNNTSMMFLS